MSPIRYTILHSAPNPLYILADTQRIIKIGLTPPSAVALRNDRSPLLQSAAKELNEYFSGERRRFGFPIDTAFLPFFHDVYAVVSAIPYGETRSLDDILKALGHRYERKAVMAACRYTPLPICIPVHRVEEIDDHSLYVVLRQMEKRYAP